MDADLPPIGQKEIDLAARIMVIALIDTEAETMRITQEGFHGKGKVYGDFEIITRRLNPATPKELLT